MSATLCIDIGQTRIKAAVLKDDVASLDDLRKAKSHVVPTLGWLNASFPRLIDESYWPSLTYNHPIEPFERLAITVPTKVVDGRIHAASPLLKWGMPQDPAVALQRHADLPALRIRIANDAHAWLQGAIAYCDLARKPFAFPCALIAVGTGIAFAVAESAERFEVVEFADERIDWTPLRKEADITAEVYEMLGVPFFDAVRRDHKDWDFAHICEVYTRRFTVFLNIVMRRWQFRTLFIGGGHANYLHRSDIRTETPVDHVIALRGRNRDIDIDADLIPLLGLLNIL